MNYPVRKIDEKLYLVHDTNARDLFELRDVSSPRGTAWFWLGGEEDQFGVFACKYHFHKPRGLRRRLVYSIKTTITLLDLSLPKTEESLLQEIDDDRQRQGLDYLPTKLTGRGSILDRYPEEESGYIRGYIMDRGVDGLFEHSKVVSLFRPENHLKISRYQDLEYDSIYTKTLKMVEIYHSLNSQNPSDFVNKIKGDYGIKFNEAFPWARLRLWRLPELPSFLEYTQPSSIFENQKNDFGMSLEIEKTVE